MSWRTLLLLPLLSLAASAQSTPPAFYSWHTLEYQTLDRGTRSLTLQLQFRTRAHFSRFNLFRGSIIGNQKLGHGWIATAGYFRQQHEAGGDGEWSAQQRVFSSISRPWRTRRIQHVPRFQYDYLFAMPTPSYGRYRFAWQTEWIGRFRPYAAAEEFIEHAGIQRFRPRAGVRFAAGAHMDADIVYIYDRIYLRNAANRHILQTTFSFHRAGSD